MLEYNLPRYLPSAEELPDSDETPVDNELQELIPGLLAKEIERRCQAANPTVVEMITVILRITK
ncbi:hypothetical protein H6G97_29255 [Nostoc flagelliforme FACHB-838]|uniref:Uncharacterized protein n=1 Tax=Nostoc flagelliforme FACHB-838 TaxID=2692904 RepID=A0ABR8DVG1_9NOSO|nr:hypothetical protein [Nostoc flagelliforme]MBD2533431.1 hypothetical protein [Nostoc flagelliforme FACHB-838]